MRNFRSNKLLAVADVSVNPIRYFKTTPERICFEKDLYEIKNEEGTYFDRNALEDRFAFMESWFSSQLKDILLKNDKSDRMTCEQDAMLALLLAVQLTRLPAVKQIVYGKNNIGTIEKNYIYQSIINSDKKAIEYLSQNNVSVPAELLQENEDKTLIDAIASHLLSNCFFYIIDASTTEGKFIIADQPVLIRPFEDAQYIFPISPDLAVACCAFASAHGGQAEGFVNANEEMVYKINVFSYKQCNHFVIAKEFTENHLKILERKYDK